MIPSVNTNDKLFIDASALIAILNQEDNQEQIINLVSKYQSIYISNLSLMFCYRHYLRLKNINQKNTLSILELIEEEYYSIDLTKQIYEKAKKLLTNSDFEDAIQVATAIENDVFNILTCDKGFYNQYKNKLFSTVNLNVILID